MHTPTSFLLLQLHIGVKTKWHNPLTTRDRKDKKEIKKERTKEREYMITKAEKEVRELNFSDLASRRCDKKCTIKKPRRNMVRRGSVDGEMIDE